MREIKIDFDNPGLPQRLDVVENDAQSRFFKAVLYKDGKAYAAPSGATYSIMYRGFGPQNEGWYDTINDGAGKRAACSVSGNVVTCEIARQALRVPGHVSVVLCATGSNGYMLHGWPIDCNCRNDNYTGGTSVESFFYITQITNADWTSAIKTWEELKNMIDPTLSLSGKAADAAKVGEAVGQIKEELWEDPSIYSPFHLGDIQGGKIRNISFRIVSTNIIHAVNDLYITIDKNRRAAIVVYNEAGEYQYDLGWQTLNYVVPANTYFRIVISAFAESTDEERKYKADIETLLSYVKFNSVRAYSATKLSVKSVLKKLCNRDKVTFYDYFYESEWVICNNITNGEIVYTGRSRISNLAIIHNDFDFNLDIETGTRVGVSFFDHNGKFISDAGWQSGHLFIPKNSYFRLLISQTPETTNEEFRHIADIRKYLKFVSFENYPFNKKLNAYPYNKELTLSTFLQTSDSKRMQGGVIANGYLYYAQTDETTVTLHKYDLDNQTEVLTVTGNYGHAGDLTFNYAQNQLVVINGATSETTVWFLNADDLQLVSSKTISTTGRRFGGIAYNRDADGYVLEFSKNGTWRDYSFAVCDNNFNILYEFETIKNGYLMQGIDYHNNYVFALYESPKIIIVYDIYGNYIGCHKFTIQKEPEFITFNNEDVIIGSDGDGMIRTGTRKYLWE